MNTSIKMFYLFFLLPILSFGKSGYVAFLHMGGNDRLHTDLMISTCEIKPYITNKHTVLTKDRKSTTIYYPGLAELTVVTNAETLAAVINFIRSNDSSVYHLKRKRCYDGDCYEVKLFSADSSEQNYIIPTRELSRLYFQKMVDDLITKEIDKNVVEEINDEIMLFYKSNGYLKCPELRD